MPNQARGKESVVTAEVGTRLHKSSRIDNISKLVSTRYGAIDFEILLAREKFIDHSFALFRCDAASRIDDRTSRTHQRRRLLEHSRLDRRHARRVGRLQPPFDL